MASAYANLNARLSRAYQHETYVSDEGVNGVDGWVSSSRSRAEALALYVRPEPAKLLLSLGKTWKAPAQPAQAFKVARAIYLLAHERGHIQHGFKPERDNELLANQYAAEKFVYFARRLGLSQPQVKRLWTSLPATWRKPA